MDTVVAPTLWRKRRLRRFLITRLPLRLAWALRSFSVTAEQDAVIQSDFQAMLADVLSSCEQPSA